MNLKENYVLCEYCGRRMYEGESVIIQENQGGLENFVICQSCAPKVETLDGRIISEDRENFPDKYEEFENEIAEMVNCEQNKIILDKKGELGLFEFFKTPNWVEFVVATFNLYDENKEIGDTVKSWNWGHYFKNKQDAIEYFNERTNRKDVI